MSHTTAKYLLFSFLSLFLFPVNVQAQITPDGTTSTTVTPTENGVQIDNGDRSGGNLFHSFQDFSVLTGTEAHFNNASDIANIFSRVTGGNISEIGGLLRANGTANLFLINPAGIIFGENASLNIGGSFFATTADSILFGEDLAFSASDRTPPSPLLTSSIPIGANFRDNPGNIENQSSGLQVNPGQSLTLLGGNINFDGGEITAEGATVELGGLTAAGTVDIVDGSLSFRDGITRGDITLDNASEINVRSNGGGRININGNNITLQNNSQLRGGISSNSLNPEAQAGDITLNATGHIELLGEESRIINSTFGQGNAGNIFIESTSTNPEEGIKLIGGDIFNNVENGSQQRGQGNAGNIVLKGNFLSLEEGSQIQSLVRGPRGEDTNAGQGNAGNIEITVDKEVKITGESATNSPSSIFSEVQEGDFDAGDITITISDGSFVMQRQEEQDGSNRNQLESSAAGTGQAGTIDINASDTITISGSNVTTNSDEGLAGIVTLNASDTITISNSDVKTDGNEGLIFLGTNNLFDLAQPNNNETNNIETAKFININNSEISATNDSDGGFAGIVTLNASDTITISNSDVKTDGNEGLIFLGNSFYENILLTPPSTVNIEGTRTPNEETNTDNSFNYTTNLTTTNLDRDNDNGLAGAIEIYTRDSINISGSRLDSTTDIANLNSNEIEANDNLSTINLTASQGSIFLEDSAISATNNSDRGNAGGIFANASDTITISNSNVETNGQNGVIILSNTDSDSISNILDFVDDVSNNDIEIETAKFIIDNIEMASSIEIKNKSEISATNNSNGRNAGGVFVNATDTISIDSSEITTDGQLGAIFLGTPNLSNLEESNNETNNIETARVININKSVISATNNNDGTNNSDRDNAGGVFVNATDTITIDNSKITTDGNVGLIFLGTTNLSDLAESNHDQTNNIETTGFININESTISADNSGGGNAGGVAINSDTITINDSDLTTNGQSGVIILSNTDLVDILEILDFVDPSNNDDSNNIETARSIEIINNSELSATNNRGENAAGIVLLNASDIISIDNSTVTTNGNAGLIFLGSLDTDNDNLADLVSSLPFDPNNVNLIDIFNLLQSNQSNPNTNIDNVDLLVSILDALPIEATRSIEIENNSGISAESDSGTSGNIGIFANSLTLNNNSSISSQTESGIAGFITIGNENNLALETLTINNSQITVNGKQGTGGDINITANSIKFDNSRIFSNVESGGGNAGDITIESQSLSLLNGSQIETSVNQSDPQNPNAGQGNAGNIIISTGSFVMERQEGQDGGRNQLNSSAAGTGRAGIIVIDASETITINGSDINTNGDFGFIFLGNLDTDNAALARVANLIQPDNNIDPNNVDLADVVSLLQSADFNNVDLPNLANSLPIETTIPIAIENNSNITAISDSARSGSIVIFANSLNLKNDSSISSETEEGTAGNIIIGNNNTALETLTINNSQITVNGKQGTGGDINITANSLEQNGGRITADTGSREGANINLNIRDLWVLSNESLVSTNAQGEGATGGNININQDDSFDSELLIFAFSPTGIQGNDITANGLEAEAGNINLKATGVFGIEARDIAPEDTSNNSLNDLTATSNIGSDGNITLETNIDDPSSGLVELPESVGDASDQITQNPCEEGVGSEFVVTGKGGLAANPQNNFSSDGVRVALVEPVTENSQNATGSANGFPSQEEAKEIVPAKGWVFNDRGQVVLTAYDPTQKGIQRSQETFTGCTLPQNQAQQHN